MAALTGQVISSVFSGQDLDVRGMFEEATQLAERTETWWMLAMAAGFSGATLWDDDHERGEALLVRAAEAARLSGSPYAIGSAALAHGRMLGKAGRTDEAVAEFGVAIERFGEVGDERFVLAARSDMTHALRRGGRLDDAAVLYRETIGGWVRLGHRGAVANQLENVAFLAIARRQPERAARLLGAAEAIREAAGAPMAFDEVREMTAHVEQLRALTDRLAIDAWWAHGRAMSMADAVALAVAE